MHLVREPIYQQLSTQLRQLARRTGPGGRFPAERDLARIFGVSRATANKAVASLVGEGVLVSRKGLGTFVADLSPSGPMRYDLRSLVSFTERAKASGRVPATRVLTFEPADPPAVVREALGDQPLLHVVRLRLADEVPLILEDRWVVRSLCPAITEADARGSLYGYWVDTVGLAITGAEQTVTAVAASAFEARWLGLNAGEPALCVTAVGRVGDGGVGGRGRRLWWERTLYRADRYVFEATLSGVGGRGAVGGAVVERTGGEQMRS